MQNFDLQLHYLLTGAKFKKYMGHSAHVTNVRFSHDQRHLISVGGADHAVFQWDFLSGEEREGQAGVPGSDSEESDSDISDAASLDSEVEREQEKTYDRCSDNVHMYVKLICQIISMISKQETFTQCTCTCASTCVLYDIVYMYM